MKKPLTLEEMWEDPKCQEAVLEAVLERMVTPRRVTPADRPACRENKLGMQEAADVLGISPLTLRVWVKKRKLPYYRLGRRVVFSPTDLANFLAANRIAAIS